MKFLRFSIVMLALIISGSMMAQSQKELSQLMRERGEYYFTLNVNDPHEIQAINELCSVDGFKGTTVVCYANQQQYDRLLKAGYQPNLQTPPSLLETATMWDGRATYEWNSYLTYEQFVSMMEGFPTSVTNGYSCTLLDLGTLSTSNHRRLLGVRLNNGQPNGKPKFLYTSTMHGDEVTGMILMLRLIDEFCTSTDSRIQNILDNVDLFIFPCTNPDGTYHGGNSTVNGAQRYNGNNVDLNRHFPDFDDGAHPDGANSYQDEAQWMMDLAQEYLFTMGANYHGGAEIVNYPWDTYQPLHPDDAWWQYVSREYAQLCQAVSSSYMTTANSSGDTPSGITNGYAWYTITGSRQDYMNYYGQCREVTIECSKSKTPSASTLPNYWNYNHNAMLTLIEECLKGVHGYVYDAVTLEPIEGVTVTVENHDALGSSVTSHTIGDFHRPIKAGTYTITFAKQGYYSQSVQVTVTDGNTENLTIYLEPNLNLNADFTASATDASLGQSINFTDTSEGMVSSWNWTFEGGTPSTSTEQNPTGITYNTPGDYTVTLTVTGPTGLTDSEIKENYIHVTESILMQNGTVTTCSGLFYDPSGANANYGDQLDLTMTLYPETPGAFLNVAFSQFNTESNYDFLYIYDGTTTSATQIGKYSGTTSPGTITATNNEGALTFRFTSDQNTNREGWVASLSCIVVESTITATADPAEGGTISGTGTFTSGETCTLTATPAEGYRFIHWTENGEVVSSEATYSFQVTTDRALVAVFGSTDPIDITVSANPARGGSVNGGGEFLSGETCTVTATPNEGYSFTNWTENDEVVSSQATYSFEVTNARALVANFTFDAAVSGKCYYPATTVSAGSYVMGHIDGTTLASPTHNNASTVTTTSTDITPTDYGFSVDEETTLPQVTLTEYQTSGQYYISYNGRYLAKSNSGSNLTWGTSTSQNGRWHIDSDGHIYVAASSGSWGGSTTNYYLYYNNGSFALSTTQQSNISFYTEGDCPVSEFTITATAEPAEGGIVEGADIYFLGETCTLTATANEGYQFVNWTENGEEVSTEASISFEVTADRELVANFEQESTTTTQTCTFSKGWNWWSTNLNIDMDELKAALANNASTITSKEDGFVSYFNSTGWTGGLNTLDVAQMYKIKAKSNITIELNGAALDPSTIAITLNPEDNWIGFPLSHSMSIGEAFANANPVNGDQVSTFGLYAQYYNGVWYGTLETLEPGRGYIYNSVASETKTFFFPSSK